MEKNCFLIFGRQFLRAQKWSATWKTACIRVYPWFLHFFFRGHSQFDLLTEVCNMTFNFYPYPTFSTKSWKFLWKFFASHLVSTTCKLTPIQVQLESALNSLYQKQPSRGVFRKIYSANMHAASFIYRATPKPKCNLLNSHFDMGILL